MVWVVYQVEIPGIARMDQRKRAVLHVVFDNIQQHGRRASGSGNVNHCVHPKDRCGQVICIRLGVNLGDDAVGVLLAQDFAQCSAKLLVRRIGASGLVPIRGHGDFEILGVSNHSAAAFHRQPAFSAPAQ